MGELLNVDPLELSFPLFEPNKIITCPLRLTNNTAEKVAFRCLPEPHADGLLSELRGIVLPRSANTYFVMMENQPITSKGAITMILESCVAHEDIPDPDDHFLTEFKQQIRGRVHQVTLTVVCNSGDTMTPEVSFPFLRNEAHYLVLTNLNLVSYFNCFPVSIFTIRLGGAYVCNIQ